MPRTASVLVLVLTAACGDPLAPPGSDETKKDPTAKEPATSEPAVLAPAPNEPAPADPAPAAAKPPCAVGFTRDVLPLLVSSCGSTVCHAETNDPRVDENAAKPTYDGLIAKGFGSIEWNDPHSDFAEMYDPGFEDIVDGWRMCGAPFE